MFSVTEPAAFPPCPAPFNLAHYVLSAGRHLGNKTAIEIVGGPKAESWGYDRLIGAVESVAGGLASLGLRPGGLVLLRLGNSIDFPLAFLGSIAAGLRPVCTPATLTVAEVSNLAADLRPDLIIAADGVSVPDGSSAELIDSASFKSWLNGPAGGFEMGDPERPAYLTYTSGTSGCPRAVVHAHRAVWARRMMWNDWYGLRESDRMMHAGAFNWTFTLGTGLLDPWAVGATALVPAEGTPADRLFSAIEASRATIFAAAPGVYRKMLKQCEVQDLPELRHGLSAGERLPVAVAQAWRGATGKQIYEAYGLSECSTFLSASPAHPAPEGTLGFAQTGRHIAILDMQGQPCPPGVAGALAVHKSDPGLALSYYGNADEFASKFSGQWFVTGDQARMDSDGAITILGREDDMMNAGGFRVSPFEVEAALATCPDVGDVAVTEVELGPAKSIVAAFFTGTVSKDGLSEYARMHLAPYKVPRYYQRVEVLPTTVTGKVNRRVLREEWGIKP